MSQTTLSADVLNQRIISLAIPIEYDTAKKLIEMGVSADGLFYLNTGKSFSGTCYYKVVGNFLQAQSGLYMATDDEVAIQVALLPTVAARVEYLKAIDYGNRGGKSYLN